LIAGIQRLNKTEVLQYNGLFLDLVGLKKFPERWTPSFGQENAGIKLGFQALPD
jgi:hypothetical protein